VALRDSFSQLQPMKPSPMKDMSTMTGPRTAFETRNCSRKLKLETSFPLSARLSFGPASTHGPRSTMKIAKLTCALLLILLSTAAFSQSKLSPKWEELTAGDFVEAIHQTHGTCMLPFGILEKHGPHLPLGTDLINVRHAALLAAQKEYVVV